MYLKHLYVFFILFILIVSCAPYKMKAIRAKRDANYQLVIKFGLRHLKNHPNDDGAIRLLEEAAEQYYDAVNEKISHYEQLEEWSKVSVIAGESYETFSQLIGIVGIEFPTKTELDYLANKKDYSNVNRAEEIYQQGLQFYQDEDFSNALDKFTEVKEIIRHYKDVDNLLSQTKQKIAADEYKQALRLISQNEHEQAIQKLEMVVDYSPDFSEAQQKLLNTKNDLAQQYFQQAASYDQQSNYKAAYNLMSKVLSYQNSYPGAREKYNELRDKLTVRLAVFPFVVKNLSEKFGETAYQKITSNIGAKKSDFIMLLDRQNPNTIFQEQALPQTGAIDEKHAVEVGKLSGVNTMVLGSVSLISISDVKPRKTIKTGEYKQSYLDPRKVKRTRKVPFTYTVYEKSRSVEMNLNYRIISVETGEIVFSKSDNETVTDVALWLTCPKERVKDLPSEYKNKVSSSSEPKSKDSLISEAIENLSRHAADVILSQLVNGG